MRQKRWSKLAYQCEDKTMQACLCWDSFRVSHSPLCLKKAEFWNKQGHIIQQQCVSDERGRSLNLQFHAAPPRLWFLPLGLPDKIPNFKHAVDAHPVRAEIGDEALWVPRCFYIYGMQACCGDGDNVTPRIQNAAHGKSHVHSKSQSAEKSLCTY